MLPPEEIGRRIVAARVLLDISQDEMSARGHEDFGLDKHELARVERGTLKKGVQPYHLRVLADVLDVPMSWFTEPREAIVYQATPNLSGLLGVLERYLKDQGPAAEDTG